MNECLLKTADVLSRIQLSRAMLYRLLSRGEFPAPRRVGRAVRWLRSDIDAWLSSSNVAKEA